MSEEDDIREGLRERDSLKSFCKRLIVIKDKDKKVMDAQEKEINRLMKTHDPKRLKAIADLAAMARANRGIKDIEEYMSKINDS